jgi:hypothetical protein
MYNIDNKHISLIYYIIYYRFMVISKFNEINKSFLTISF